MKFSFATIAAIASTVTAASLPSAFTLVADGGLMAFNKWSEYLYVNKNSTTNQIAIFHSTPQTGTVSFTSVNAAPTGFQSIYVIEKAVAPIGLTNFSMNSNGYFAHNNNNWFAVGGYGSNPQKTVYWYGAHNSEYRALKLWVKEFRE
ncbi:hypothetical protein BDV06DRAFT_222782 [Aspergillus oleicola]